MREALRPVAEKIRARLSRRSPRFEGNIAWRVGQTLVGHPFEIPFDGEGTMREQYQRARREARHYRWSTTLNHTAEQAEATPLKLIR